MGKELTISEVARLGGQERAKRLTAAERSKIAAKAGRASGKSRAKKSSKTSNKASL